MKFVFKPESDFVDDKGLPSTAEVTVDLSSTYNVTLHFQDPPTRRHHFQATLADDCRRYRGLNEKLSTQTTVRVWLTACLLARSAHYAGLLLRPLLETHEGRQVMGENIIVRAPYVASNPLQAIERAEGRRKLLSQKERPSKCDFCDNLLPPAPTDGTLGYATHLTGKVACYTCCAWSVIAGMLLCDTGDHAPEGFYYTPEPAHDDALGKGLDCYGRVTNWPGSLEMRVYAKGRQQKGGFFSAHYRFDYAQRIYFSGPNGSRWSGTYYCTPSAGNLLRNVRRLK